MMATSRKFTKDCVLLSYPIKTFWWSAEKIQGFRIKCNDQEDLNKKNDEAKHNIAKREQHDTAYQKV